MRSRPCPTALAAAVLVLTLGGCDTSTPDGGGTCASIGVPDVGSVTATTPAGPFQTACANVTSGSGDILFIAREPGSGALGGATVEIYVASTGPGTYPLGDGASSSAAFGPSPGATVAARSGSVTVESFEGGLRGTFAFVTLTGAEVTGGRFDLDL